MDWEMIKSTLGYIIGAGGLIHFLRAWIAHRETGWSFKSKEKITHQKFLEKQAQAIMEERKRQIEELKDKCDELQDCINEVKDSHRDETVASLLKDGEIARMKRECHDLINKLEEVAQQKKALEEKLRLLETKLKSE